MKLSTEAIIAIVALFVALPPIVVILIKLFRRNRPRHKIPEEDIELQPVLRTIAPSPKPPRNSPLIMSIHVAF
ncbi:hypothetical protein F4679DRAFT_533468 [Xylaria curta]|nr:hypothetical protein F4679DRAFT_533468 [Xylaria curta]